jgi:formylglycine-generating enzyme required for sulfatase activity
LGRSAAKDPKELAYQEMLLMVFFGDEKAAAKAISAAKEVGIDVSLYEARLAGAAPAGETTPQKAGLPASLASDFDVPKEPKDKHGNPIRKGSDKKTGMPLEIRHKQTGMHFVFIPAGEFLMGSPDNEKDREPGDAGREGPQHEARLTKPFYLGKYEVTQAEWKAVMANNPSAFQDDRNPVEHVYWHDCQAFLKKLNEQGRSARFSVSSEERAEARTTSLRFALPTEAQWEYACRAGTQTRFHFGDDLDYKQFTEYAWFKDNSGGTTHPVGEKKPNAWGLYDMNGNVWEWCEDWYGGYSANEVNDPPGPTTGSSRVYRGGSWLSPGANCRSAVRNHMAPGQRHSHVGCRVSLRPCP